MKENAFEKEKLIYPNLTSEQKTKNNVAVLTYCIVAVFYLFNTLILYINSTRTMKFIIPFGIPFVLLFGLVFYSYKEHNKDPFPEGVYFFAFFMLISITIMDKYHLVLTYPLNYLLTVFYVFAPLIAIVLLSKTSVN